MKAPEFFAGAFIQVDTDCMVMSHNGNHRLIHKLQPVRVLNSYYSWIIGDKIENDPFL
jgi:hypothetical protein